MRSPSKQGNRVTRTIGLLVLLSLAAFTAYTLEAQGYAHQGKHGPGPAPEPGLVWSSYYGTAADDAGEAIALAPDGCVVIAGFTMQFEPSFNIVAFVAKFAPDGKTLVAEAVLDGSIIDGAFGVAVDRDGIITVVGQTWGADFPVTDDAFQPAYGGGWGDGFITQFSPDLTEILYSSYLGGSSEECITGVALDQHGGYVVCGYTSSEDFPVTPGAFQETYGGGGVDAFVARIVPTEPPAKQLEYSTYLGGSGSDGDFDPAKPLGVSLDQRILRQAVTVMPNGNIVVFGMTWSTDFPVTPGAWQTEHSPLSNPAGYSYDDADMYLTVLDPRTEGHQKDRQLVYSTYLGGPGRDASEGVIATSSSTVTIAGLSQSPYWPVTHDAYQPTLKGFQDVVVMQLRTEPAMPQHEQIIYSTYFGGEIGGKLGFEGRDAANGLCLLNNGDIVVAGLTTAIDFPVTDASTHGPGINDMFIFRLNPKRKPADQLVYSTLFGGSGSEYLSVGPVEDGWGNVYISGDTDSLDLPGAADSWGPTYSGGTYDAIVARFFIGGQGRGFGQ